MLRCLQRESHPVNPSTIRSLPPRQRWTYADYCRIPADGKRHEILAGRHFVNPAPSPYHQFVSARLHHQLMLQVADQGRGTVLAAPIDLHLGRQNIVQPDLVVVPKRTRCVPGARKLTDLPCLLVEILSPRTRKLDQQRKRDCYERAGVREFWLVDPEAREVQQLVLRNGRYLPPIVATECLPMRALRGVTVDLRKVW
jgi:Uma2 family endonuclease